MPVRHRELHVTGRIGWLRAAVLGANDGIVSTASLVLGVAAAHSTHSNILVAGIAGLVAGAMSMAAGEYVSVHSQADTEKAELARERAELEADGESEHKELAAIYVARGLDPSLAKEVAAQLMAHDAIGAHAQGRTRNLRDIHCASYPGCVGVSVQLRYWSEPASPGHCHRSGGASAPAGFWNFTHIPRDSGRRGCTDGRRRRGGGRHTRPVLGRTGYGADRRRRSAVRNSCVAELAALHDAHTERSRHQFGGNGLNDAQWRSRSPPLHSTRRVSRRCLPADVSSAAA